MTERKVLCNNKWLSLMEMVDKEKDVNGYVYSHETRCNGNIVAILPYKLNSDNTVSFLVRKEITPCWDIDTPYISSITGGVDEGNSIITTIQLELWEEARYIGTEKEFQNLGICRGTKSCDTVYHLFGINLTDKDKDGETSGDGSELEKKAECLWMNLESILKIIQDPILAMLLFRMAQVK